MDFPLTAARLISFITSWGLPVSIVVLIISIVIDMFKRKFHWSKFALVFLVIVVVLLIIQIKLTYQVTGSILNTP